ncbi:MAG: hypothetical protein COU26_01615 [Candidatus Levybacteria bacterium CG10_big_fil_rev_8_21_14_0_10_36_30]|nr:MAG: hypothetical protein COU26_01615 [Candidatus Levybacteria bacterium CG10_big_fil_rev_8_21_14_0_10_36_30]
MARLGKEIVSSGFVDSSLNKIVVMAETRDRMIDLWNTVDSLLTQHGQPTKDDDHYRITPLVPLGYNKGLYGSLRLQGRYLEGETPEEPQSLAEFSVDGILTVSGFDPETSLLFSYGRTFEAKELGFDFETDNGQYLEPEALQKGETIVNILDRYFSKTPSSQLPLPD